MNIYPMVLLQNPTMHMQNKEIEIQRMKMVPAHIIVMKYIIIDKSSPSLGHMNITTYVNLNTLYYLKLGVIR